VFNRIIQRRYLPDLSTLLHKTLDIKKHHEIQKINNCLRPAFTGYGVGTRFIEQD
jgi:hypothetical protein